jgi:curved DNA-binding protein CbpA
MRCAAFRVPLYMRAAFRSSGERLSALSCARRAFNAPPPDYYKVLGVLPSATPDEVKSAYKKLALELHPDRNKAKDAEERFKQVSEAYSVVGNKSKRQEYDAQRQFSGVGGGSRNYESMENRGFAHAQPGGSYTVHNMSTADADKIFRELFGNVNIEQIFREFDQSQSATRSGLGENVNFNRRFGSFGNQSNLNQFFQQTAARTYKDDAGNVREESEFVDQFGRTYRMSRSSSTQENASTNTDPNEFMRTKAARDPLGRVKNASGHYTFGRRGDTNDFFKTYFGVRSHGRSFPVQMIIMLCWVIIIGSLFIAMGSFIVNHPIVMFAIFALFYLRTRGRYWRPG